MSGSIGPQMRIKQGATFSATVLFQDNLGLPLDLEAGTLSTALQSAQQMAMAGVTITAIPGAPGQALLMAPATATAAWPLGALRGDVAFLSAGNTQYSQTFLLFVDVAIAPAPAP